MAVGTCIALLTMLSLLPCMDLCGQETTASASAGVWFLCDLIHQPDQSPLAEHPLPHHHHSAPRGAFEPILVQMGLIATIVLQIGRLFTSASPLALRLSSTPPTPPPRAA
jgi:hypothetical protein